MSTILFIHERLSVTVLLFMLALGVWGLWTYLRGEAVSGSLWGALAIAELLVLGEGLLGATLFASGLRPARTGIHILYGVFMAIAIPGTFSFTRGKSARFESLVYALVAFFLAGVAIRARITGGG